ncbi:MAG: hypothetical protein JSW68_01115 [Burkholderiales bacterium]|nr:MAG: hypothetical protein JSW68_01115 [Burkholderiales bacterium]
MNAVIDRFARAGRHLAPGRRTSARGWWGLASGTSGTFAARVAPLADGTLQLGALRELSAPGQQHARRAADVAAVLTNPRAPCAMLMPEDDYKLMLMPGLPVTADERTEALRWQLKDELECPPDDAVIDCVVAPVETPGMEHGLWTVVMARRRLVFELVEPLTRTGAPIEAVDVAELAQRNLARRSCEPGRPVALLTLDARRGLLTLTRDDCMYAARRFDPLAAGLAEAADDVPRQSSLTERLALELQRTFDNVERHYGVGPVDEVIVLAEHGGTALVDGLSTLLPVQVRPFELALLCSAADPALIQRAASKVAACHAIGAALRAADEASA